MEIIVIVTESGTFTRSNELSLIPELKPQTYNAKQNDVFFFNFATKGLVVLFKNNYDTEGSKAPLQKFYDPRFLIM